MVSFAWPTTFGELRSRARIRHKKGLKRFHLLHPKGPDKPTLNRKCQKQLRACGNVSVLLTAKSNIAANTQTLPIAAPLKKPLRHLCQTGENKAISETRRYTPTTTYDGGKPSLCVAL